MAMTMQVYRINSQTREKVIVRETQTVTGNEPLPPTSALPPCICRRCLPSKEKS